MKAFAPLVLLGLLGWTAGCSSTPSTLTLAAVGPRQFPPEPASGPQGSLVVYSAFEPVAFSSDSDRTCHSDYELRSNDDKPIKRVSNRDHAFSEEPVIVKLAPGRYTVVARAVGSRRVVVPVAIDADKTTCVRLDGSEPTGSKRVAASELVSLPDGTPVGWRVKD